MSDKDQAHRQISAHLAAAERNPLKRAQHLTAATQHAEANDIAHFGRWSEESVTARNARYEERKRVEALKNRGTAQKPMECGAAPSEGRGAQAVFPQNSEGSEAAK